MKKTIKSRSAVFEVVIEELENEKESEDLLMAYESAEDRVRAFLDDVDAFCKAWIPRGGKPGSDEMVREARHWARFLRGELEVEQRRNRWRIADYAMSLSKWWRDFEANEALHRPLESKRRMSAALPGIRKKSADKRRKITMRKYRSANKKKRTRKELASLLEVSLTAVRKFERANKISPT